MKNKAESIEKYRQGICLLDRETIERLEQELAAAIVRIPREDKPMLCAA